MSDEQLTGGFPLNSLHEGVNGLVKRIVSRDQQSTIEEVKTQRISKHRRDESLDDQAFNIFGDLGLSEQLTKRQSSTVLYLAYGSNLSSEKFKGARGIKPIAQINVVVPSMRLVFDLPGIPYAEPCFANSAFRATTLEGYRDFKHLPKYHKDRWSKGLVGIVYELTKADYAHVIETEGAGVGYQDILATCYPLNPSDTSVPLEPSTDPFKAHTLFASANWGSWDRDGDIMFKVLNLPGSQREPGYAQPSARYLNLLTTGAEEHNIPKDYQEYLKQIRPFTITSTGQQIGQYLFLGFWGPILYFILKLQERLADKKGISPPWVSHILIRAFRLVWLSYHHIFKPLFGDGERTQ